MNLNVVLQFSSGGSYSDKEPCAVHVCGASGREQASKRYKMFTDIFMNNSLLISQQPEQILALLFFLEST